MNFILFLSHINNNNGAKNIAWSLKTNDIEKNKTAKKGLFLVKK